MYFKHSDKIIKSISIALVFLSAVAVLVLAVAAFLYEGEFVSALALRIKPSPRFVLTTLSVLVMTSILYTPFSYGISIYFLKSKTQKTSVLTVFYLFKNIRLLAKAIAVDTIRRVLVTVLRIFVLAAAVVLEIILLSLFENVTRSVFVAVTVVMWCAVIVLFFVIKLRFILCKYVLISRHTAKITDCVRIGCRASDKRILNILGFYLKYLARSIYLLVTVGRLRSHDSFCTYAVELVQNY